MPSEDHHGAITESRCITLMDKTSAEIARGVGFGFVDSEVQVSCIHVPTAQCCHHVDCIVQAVSSATGGPLANPIAGTDE